MSNIFLISDTHFRHKNILTFGRKDGTSLRPYFDSIEEHDEWLIKNWNSVVNVKDKVYHLGDIGFFNITQMDEIFQRLNGEKVLIKGNHDELKANQYLKYFKDIRASHTLDRFILSHIPVHPSALFRWKGCIHGHVHSESLEDTRYFNVSVENINYTPLSFETLRKEYEQRKEKNSY